MYLEPVEVLIADNAPPAGLLVLSSAMLHYYRFYFACFCAFLATPVICKETFYKLASKDSSGAPVTDDNVPFLTQSFFTCGSNDDCTKIAKVKENSEEVIGQQKVKEGAVVYEKVNTPNQGKYILFAYLHQGLNCYALEPWKGHSKCKYHLHVFFYKEPLHKELTCRPPEYLRNL